MLRMLAVLSLLSGCQTKIEGRTVDFLHQSQVGDDDDGKKSDSPDDEGDTADTADTAEPLDTADGGEREDGDDGEASHESDD